jgi:hypothetical protein
MAADISPLPEDLIVALDILAKTLPTFQARYALIGGIAIGMRSRIRATEDVDLLLTVPQLELPRLLESLVDQGFSCDVLATIQEWNQHHFVAFAYKDVRIDWVKPRVPAYQHVLDSAISENREGRELRIATAEGLIVLKLIAARTQDFADIESLLGVNAGRLDLGWIEKEWRTLFELDDPRWLRYQTAISEYYECQS